MIRRTVKKGKRKYRPGHGLCLRLNQYGYTLKYNIPAEAWRAPRLNAQGENAEQINKLGGVSFFSIWFRLLSFMPNSRALLTGFRSAKVEGQFEIFAYSNDRITWSMLIARLFGRSYQNWTYKKLLTVPADSDGSVTVEPDFAGAWLWVNEHEGKLATAQLTCPYLSRQFNVGPHFGGTEKAYHTHSIKTEQT